MSDARWRISVTTPDWGEDHLTTDAIVAFVDDELDQGPHQRASRHVAQCPECAAQVVAQRQARSALRAAGGPHLPSSLLMSLRSIPHSAELPGPPAGLAVTGDGQLVALAGPERVAQSPSPAPVRESRDAGRRRLRLGTGVAVTGLALGALAFGSAGAAGTAGGPAGGAGAGAPPSAERGVLGGPVLGGAGAAGVGGRDVAEARLRLAPTTPAAVESFLGPDRSRR